MKSYIGKTIQSIKIVDFEIKNNKAFIVYLEDNTSILVLNEDDIEIALARKRFSNIENPSELGLPIGVLSFDEFLNS